jgi:hypothetical protein
MSTVPRMSRLCVVESRDSLTAQTVAPAATTPTGTLTQKTADHEKCSTRNPPSSGPIARPRPEIPAQMPMAWGSCFRGNADTMIESESGFRSAPPTPCTARAPMSCVSLCASAHAAEASVKIARPTRKMRFRPKRSPSFPPSRIRVANTRT